MQIILVENETPSRDSSGGVMSYLINISKYFKKIGLKTHLIGSGTSSEDYVNIHFDKFSSISKNPKTSNFSFMRCLFRSRTLNSIGSDDIIHVQRAEMVIPIALRKKNKVICTLHGGQDKAVFQKKGYIFGMFYSFLQRIGFYMADHLIAVDEKNMKRYIKKYPWIKNKISLIPISVDTNKFFPMNNASLRKKHNLPQDKKIILYIGRLQLEKNIPFLIESFKSIENKNIFLLIIGSGLMEAELKRSASDILNIRFMSELRNDLIPEIINCADVLALTSFFEGSPTVVKEALCCNVPVISTDVGDVRDIIELVDGGEIIGLNKESFKNGLEKILSKPDFNFKANRDQFGLEVMAQKTIAIYNKVKNYEVIPKVAYITSGKTGLHSFTFRELELIEQSNIDITLCLTQLHKGIYMPKYRWNVKVFSKLKSTLYLGFFIIFHPFLFFKLLYDAITTNSILMLFVAIYFQFATNKTTSIHCQMGDHKLFIGYYLSKILKIPLSVTIHAHELYSSIIYGKNFEKYKSILNDCEQVFTISDFNKNYLINNIGVLESKISVMRLYPAHIPDFKNKVKFLVIGNWVRKKGYEFLFKTIKELDRDDYVFWIVGGKTYSIDSIDLDLLIKKYKIEEKVKILGYQKENVIKILLEQCDVFCLTSITDYDKNGNIVESEGLPVSLMEAIIFEKPIISTKHAGIPELIDKLLVTEDDVDELKDAITYLLENKGEWSSLAASNRKILDEKFTTKNVNNLLDLFNKFGNKK